MRKHLKHDEKHVEKPAPAFPVAKRNNGEAYRLTTARSTRPAKAVTTWQVRNKRKYRGGNAVPGPDAPVTTTGLTISSHPQIIIGKIMPCNCDDPIILQFADGSLDFFWLKECTITELPVTPPKKIKTGPRGFQEATLKKFIAIHSFLDEAEQSCAHSTIKRSNRFGVAAHSSGDSPVAINGI